MFRPLYSSYSLIFILIALSVLSKLLKDIETKRSPRAICAITLKGLIYFLFNKESNNSYMYLKIIIVPANMDISIAKLFELNLSDM